MIRSGLGNRLSFVLSCQAIADAEGRQFFYHWPIGEDVHGRSFGARFDELWDYRGGSALHEPGPSPMLEFSQYGVADLATFRDAPILSLTGNRTVKGFGGERYWGDLLADLSPSDEVSAIAESSRAGLGAHYVGVQVRAHPTLSPKKALTESPVSWFIDRMTQLRSEDPSIRFFLSCDWPAAEEEILRAVPGAITNRKSGTYNSRQGLLESVADLTVLSGAEQILAPAGSTFATLAWLMARKAMPIVTSARVRPAVPRLTE